jgi:integrase
MSWFTRQREVETILQAMFCRGAAYTMSNGKPMVDRLPAFPRKLKEGQPLRGFIKDDQLAALAANAKEPWLRCLIECAYRFGFRKGEPLRLRARQVDLLDGLIVLEDSKSGDPRTIPINDVMRRLFVELVRGKKAADFVFTRPNGRVVRDY